MRQNCLVVAKKISFRFFLAHSTRLDAENCEVGDAEIGEQEDIATIMLALQQGGLSLGDVAFSGS